MSAKSYASRLPGRPNEIKTHEGGKAYDVGLWEHFTRFLILGTTGGTFYVGESKLTDDALDTVRQAFATDARRALNRVIEISRGHRAAKRDPVIVALAIGLCDANPTVRGMVADVAADLMTTGNDWLTLCKLVDQMRGWGRVIQRMVDRWYNGKTPDRLAYQLIKYQQRDGWSHTDVIHLAKIVPRNADQAAIFTYLQKRDHPLTAKIPAQIVAFETLKKLDGEPKQAAELIRAFKLPREAVPSQWLNSPEVWDALLDDMPMHALLRNLGKLSELGMLNPLSTDEQRVVFRLSQIGETHTHPYAVLVAMRQYAQGHGMRSSKTWPVNARIVDALDAAFYASFKNVPKTGKNILLAVDTSGSMTNAQILNSPVSASEAAAAMALITASIEPNAAIVCFDTEIVPLTISPRMRLDDVLTAMRRRGGGTVTALPYGYALDANINPDAVVMYTDSETSDERTMFYAHKLRVRGGNKMKAAVVGLTATKATVLAPRAWTFDVVGFDAAAPGLIADFILGEV